MPIVLCFGAPERIRTPGLLIRSQTLYPAELRAQVVRPLSRLAEREGFEPSMEVLPPYSLSRGAPSAARPPLRATPQLTLPWRRVRDSNPRTSRPVYGFQDRRLRPLGQPSGQPSTSLKPAVTPCQPVRNLPIHTVESVVQDRPCGQRWQVYARVLGTVNDATRRRDDVNSSCWSRWVGLQVRCYRVQVG